MREIESLIEIEHGYYLIRVWRPHKTVKEAIDAYDKDVIGLASAAESGKWPTDVLIENIAALPGINAVQVERAFIPVKYMPMKIRHSVLIYPEWP